MSQTKTEPLTITATITLDDQGDPQAVTVENIGSIPKGACREIAAEALDSHFGITIDHGWRVQLFPEEEGDDFKVFEIYKTIRHTLNDIRKD